MKKHFNKKFVMTKEDNVFKSSTKPGSNITRKYRDSVHIYCNINFKLNHKTPVVFHNQKNYVSHLVIQELGKLNLKISVTSK